MFWVLLILTVLNWFLYFRLKERRYYRIACVLTVLTGISLIGLEFLLIIFGWSIFLGFLWIVGGLLIISLLAPLIAKKMVSFTEKRRKRWFNTLLVLSWPAYVLTKIMYRKEIEKLNH